MTGQGRPGGSITVTMSAARSQSLSWSLTCSAVP